ncbi:MAG: NmrA/HSCARG family protein [Acidobacteria bacterium]|nr:NmrA/HSCARG family protein [Acidobacteriota bacterium]
MRSEKGTILVTGATGRQGGAVARHLRTSGWRVRALTRDPQKPAAQTLAGLGVEVVMGDLDDRNSLAQALKDVYGVFSVQNFWETGAAREIQQGKTLADAAKAAGVAHLVYSSVGGAERSTGVPHFDSKWEIEQHIRALGLPATILRPVFYMDNFEGPNFRPAILQGTLTMAMRPDRPLQMIAVEDIGAIAALAFEKPAEFKGRAIELAGDEMTMPQAAEAFSRVMQRTVRFVEQPIEQVRSFSPEAAIMFEWFDQKGYAADIQGLRALYPALMNFERWLQKSGWGQLSAKA